MEKLNIISSEKIQGGLIGYLKDKPNVVAEGENHVELVKNIIQALKKEVKK